MYIFAEIKNIKIMKRGRKPFEDRGIVRDTVQISVQVKMIEKFGQRKLNQIAVQAIEKEYLEFDKLE